MLEAVTAPSRPRPVVIMAHSDQAVIEVTAALDAVKQQKGKYRGQMYKGEEKLA